MKGNALLTHAILALFLAACGEATPTPAGPRTLTMMTHDSFAVSEEVIAEFQAQHNATVQILTSGDAVTVVSLAILNKDAPLADLVFGIDNTVLTRALEADILEVYASPLLAEIPAEFKLDEVHRVTPVDYGDVCLNYDKAYFNEHNLAIPDSLEDLATPEYANLLVVENPAASSPGLAFLLTTVGHFGQDGYLDFWSKLRANGVKVVEDWETAYYTEFSGSSGQGAYPLVVSYASSPPAEVIFAEETPEEAPTGSVITPDTCFRQIEFVGILRDTENRDLAEAWIDFMLSPTFQNNVPMQMFMFPVNTRAELPNEFIQHAKLASQPATVAPNDINTYREEWIEAWTETMLR